MTLNVRFQNSLWYHSYSYTHGTMTNEIYPQNLSVFLCCLLKNHNHNARYLLWDEGQMSSTFIKTLYIPTYTFEDHATCFLDMSLLDLLINKLLSIVYCNL